MESKYLEDKTNETTIARSSKKMRFKIWLASYFIEKGNYNITNKAIKIFSDNKYVLHSEFAESYSDRNREYRLNFLTKEKIEDTAKQKIAKEIENGNSLDLYLRGYVMPKKYYSWKNKSTRIEVIKQFVSIINKDSREIMKKDFSGNGLGALILHYYKGSPYSALKEAGFVNFEPWEMKQTPKNTFLSKENRIRATHWLVKKTNKDSREINEKDFYNNGLIRLINPYYKGSPYLALKEAGLTNFEPWEMKITPKGTFKSKENRIRAVKWLVKKTNKDSREIIVKDFLSNGLVRLINYYYKGSPYRAMKEAGLVSKPSDMKHKLCRIKK